MTRGLDPIDSLSKATGAGLDRVDRQIEANTRAIAELGNKIDGLATVVGNQTSALERLERAVDKLVTGIDAQRAIMADFLVLAKEQAATIRVLAGGKT